MNKNQLHAIQHRKAGMLKRLDFSTNAYFGPKVCSTEGAMALRNIHHPRIKIVCTMNCFARPSFSLIGELQVAFRFLKWNAEAPSGYSSWMMAQDFLGALQRPSDSGGPGGTSERSFKRRAWKKCASVPYWSFAQNKNNANEVSSDFAEIWHAPLPRIQ